MRVIGLTGGIASGKSAAAACFERLGAEVIDTDIIAREVVAPDTPGLAAVIDAFGEEILAPDGELDRRRLRERVFRDDSARARLESLLHPLIERETMARVAASAGPYVVLVVPLLVERGWTRLVDRVLVVDVPAAVQRQRLMTRDHIDVDQADAILATQADRAKRLEAADDVLDNTADLEHLQRQVAALHGRYAQRRLE